MKQILKIYLIPIGLLFFLMLFNGLSFAQESPQAAQPQETQSPAAQSETETPGVETVEPEATPSQIAVPQTAEPQDTQWVWGEVVSIDTNSGQILVKYLDYETDSEKEIALDTSLETTYENISTLSEIKPKDTVSIDYVISADGKNIAKNISVEKLETSPEESSTESTLPSEQTAPSESSEALQE